MPRPFEKNDTPFMLDDNKRVGENCISTVNDVRLLTFRQLGDEHGHLIAAECGKDIPFDVKRVFYIYGTDKDTVRGRHANIKSEFVLISVTGSVRIKVADVFEEERIFNLDRLNIGLYLPKMIWKDMYEFSPGSVLLVLSNELYDEGEYVRNWDAFRKDGK